jgi:Fe-S-cluster containining protein
MNCDGCIQVCCHTKHLVIAEKDLNFFLKAYPDLDFFQYGPFIVLNEECPFLNSGRCTIYDHRPNICKLFPFTYNGHISTACPNTHTIDATDVRSALKIAEQDVARIIEEIHDHPLEIKEFNTKLAELRTHGSSNY